MNVAPAIKTVVQRCQLILVADEKKRRRSRYDLFPKTRNLAFWDGPVVPRFRPCGGGYQIVWKGDYES